MYEGFSSCAHCVFFTLNNFSLPEFPIKCVNLFLVSCKTVWAGHLVHDTKRKLLTNLLYAF